MQFNSVYIYIYIYISTDRAGLFVLIGRKMTILASLIIVMNVPLFQVKGTPWEGSSRTVALVWSKALQKRRRVSYQLMHISDWLPTLYSAAGKKLIFEFQILSPPSPKSISLNELING